MVVVSGSSRAWGDSPCVAAGAQLGAPGDLGVSVPGQWTRLLLPPLQVQPVARLNACDRHTHTNAEDAQRMLTWTVTQAAMRKALP